MLRLRGKEEELTDKYKRRDDRIAELEYEIEKLCASQREAAKAQVQERLKKAIASEIRRTFRRTNPLAHRGPPIRDGGLEHPSSVISTRTSSKSQSA